MKNGDSRLKAIQDQTVLFIAIAWVLVGLGFLAAYFGFRAVLTKGGGFSLDNLALYGSYLQGSVAAIWSLATLLFIYVAFLGQREQLIRQDHELRDQQEQFRLQQESIKRQNFESSFFQLLNLHNQITMAMRDVAFSKQFQGRECFANWYESMKRIVFQKEVTSLERYLWLYRGHEGQLGHYFRNLYHVFKFVKNSDVEDKRSYTSLARATLSQDELALLFYNGLSPYGEKFKPLIEEFGLLENLNVELLISGQDDVKLYDGKAFE